MKRWPPVSVVIPAYNEEKTVGLVLHALARQSYPTKKQIIVVNDCSRDGTEQVVRRFAVEIITHRKNKGLAASLNDGIKKARHDVIFLIEADCVPKERTWMKKMVALLLSDSKIGSVNSHYTVPAQLITRYNFWMKLFFGRSLLNQEPVSAPKEIGKCSSRASVYRRALFQKVGLFSEAEFRTGGEDFDLSMRVRGSGFKIYKLYGKVWHMQGVKPVSASFGSYLYKRRQYGELKGVLRRKYGERFPLRKCTELLYLAAFVGLLMPKIRWLALAFLLGVGFYFAWIMRTLERSPRLALVPFAKIIGDLFASMWFVKGFLLKKQSA